MRTLPKPIDEQPTTREEVALLHAFVNDAPKATAGPVALRGRLLAIPGWVQVYENEEDAEEVFEAANEFYDAA